MALTWGDVDRTAGVIRVRRTFTTGVLSEPKNRERRDVDLTDAVVKLLGEWWGAAGSPAEKKLVFAAEVGGYLVGSTLTRGVLYPAMKRSSIPRTGPTGEERTFHSLRHTFAKLALENGAQVTWLQRQLGHSSLKVTADVYGHFERAARTAEAAKLAGAFSV